MIMGHTNNYRTPCTLKRTLEEERGHHDGSQRASEDPRQSCCPPLAQRTSIRHRMRSRHAAAKQVSHTGGSASSTQLLSPVLRICSLPPSCLRDRVQLPSRSTPEGAWIQSADVASCCHPSSAPPPCLQSQHPRSLKCPTPALPRTPPA